MIVELTDRYQKRVEGFWVREKVQDDRDEYLDGVSTKLNLRTLPKLGKEGQPGEVVQVFVTTDNLGTKLPGNGPGLERVPEEGCETSMSHIETEEQALGGRGEPGGM